MDMAENGVKMSKERLEELKAQLEEMETVRAKEVSEQIKEARSFGDLSENSEYDEAKNEQGKLYSRIAEIKKLIESAVIIDPVGSGNTVAMGSRVTVLDMTENENVTFQVVGSQEADPMKGRISDESPLGRSLIGHKSNDEVTYELNGRIFKFRIISVDF